MTQEKTKFKKQCPICKKNLFYKSKYSLKDACIYKTNCSKCAALQREKKHKDKITDDDIQKRLENRKLYEQKYYQINKEKYKKNRKKWNAKNKNKIIQYQIEYRKTEKYRKQRKITERNKRKNSSYKLYSNISRHIRKSLKNKNIYKNNRQWEILLGYTVYELKNHLEKLFQPGMTWDNYGKWHIDHIVPRSFFEFTSIEDTEFKYCWSLDNLQPLWSAENITKSNKILSQYFKS